MTRSFLALPPREIAARRLNLFGLMIALAAVPVIFAPQLYDDFTLLKQSALLVAAGMILFAFAFDGPGIRSQALLYGLAGAWLAWLLVAEFFANDRRGSLLGVYQYRQGLVTQLSYVIVLLAAARAATAGQARTVVAMPAIGLGGVFAYTFVQALGRDPIEWWLDTSERAIGTIGNANELSAYAVLALALAAPAAASRHWARLGLIGAAAAAPTFIVLEAESRGGILALVVFAAVLPAAWWLAGNPINRLRAPGIALGAGALAAVAMSFAAGGLAGSASRVEGGLAGNDAGGSTRLSLWNGTAHVIREHPIVGVGPDGLFLDFPVHRPADLAGAFERYDLVAQSSHNYVLDTAANTGLPGLLLLSALIATVATVSIRRTRRLSQSGVRAEPYIWAALAAYGALTLLNPISLAAHVLFFALLGLLAAARSDGVAQLPTPVAIVGARGILVGPALGALWVAVMLPLADLAADDGWEDLDAQRFEEAANHYHTSVNRMPPSRNYAQKRAEARLAAAVGGGEAELRSAKEAYVQLDRDFGLGAGDALGLAAIEAVLGEKEAAESHIQLALRVNPHGLHMDDYTAQMREAIANGGVLRYSQRDHWTYLEPLSTSGP